MELKDVKKQKSTWAGIIALVAAAGAFYTGDMTGAQAIQTAMLGLLGIFMPEFKKK